MTKSYWCIVALDYDRDEAWILKQSEDCLNHDVLVGGSAIEDNVTNYPSWRRESSKPGLYRITLRIVGDEDGIDIEIVNSECMVLFPDGESILK